MKRLFSLLSILAVLVAFNACKDDGPDLTGDTSDTPTVEVPKADYTVIFWAMSGGVEGATFPDLCEMLHMREDGRIGDNVNFYGLLKTSNKHYVQDSLARYNLDGTLLLDLGKKNGAVLPDSVSLDEKSVPVDFSEVNTVLQQYNAKQYAGKDYPLNNPDSMANFIKQAVAKYPAKKYILMLYGHGGGFDPTDDTPNASAYETRGCIYDDMNEDVALTADNLVCAVKRSGVNISLMFFQCCLMATLENMAAYQHCTPYIVASDEVTEGGYLQDFVANLSQFGNSDSAVVKAARKTVDYYASVKQHSSNLTSQGVYDLTKASQLLSTFTEISDWYSSAYDIDPTFINNMVSEAEMCCDLYTSSSYLYVMMRYKIYEILNKRKKHEQLTYDEMMTLIKNMVTISNVSAPYGFVVSAFVKNTLECQNEATYVGMDFDRLQKLYDQYLAQLKSMSYIRANYEQSKYTDYCYLLASPSVNIFTMNKENFHPTGAYTWLVGGEEQWGSRHVLEAKLNEYIDAIQNEDAQKEDSLYNLIFVGTYFARNSTLEDVESIYTSSQFDKQTHWSTFLKKLTTNPNHLTNPGRLNFQ